MKAIWEYDFTDEYKYTLGTTTPEEREEIFKIILERMEEAYKNVSFRDNTIPQIEESLNMLVKFFCEMRGWQPLPRLLVNPALNGVFIKWEDQNTIYLDSKLISW